MNTVLRIAVPALIAGAALLAACASGSGSGAGNLVWKEGSAPATSPGPAPEHRSSGGSGKTVTVPQDVLDELEAFFGKPQFLLAQRIEVDASRIPFRAAMVPVSDPNYVAEAEVVSQELKATGFLLRSRSPTPMVERDYPRVRVYHGLDLAAAREIQARAYSVVEESRPIFLRAVGMGDAVYRDETTGRELRQDVIVLEAEVVSGPAGYEFRQRIR
jgi:hypothetical protein